MTEYDTYALQYENYMTQLIVYQVLISIQILLALGSWLEFKAKEKSTAPIKPEIKKMYTVVLSLGTFIFIVVEWYGVADFLYDFAAFPIYCTTAVVLGNVLIVAYLFALYRFYLMRLFLTFRDTPMAIPERTKHRLEMFSMVVFVCYLLAVFIKERSEPVQVDFAWSGKAADAKPIIICRGEFSIGLDLALRIVLQCIIVVGNIGYGAWFYVKLRQMIQGMQVRVNDQEEAKHYNSMEDVMAIELYSVIKKQTVLVIISTLSTIILWTVANILAFYGSFLQILLYVDVTINCLCLHLMFGFNHKAYKKYCCVARCIGFTIFQLLKDEEMQKVSKLKKSIRLNQMKEDKNDKQQKSETKSGEVTSSGDKLKKDINPMINIQ
mmetsp:Transcript_46562/g.77371  ORF Transcript_46562/g.77371 Transcript_46562/m.77371 type:complete len:380 (-) Transcript_46562:334-1473(-)|eukprot:CAMPEP_0202702532 /NCGR_PEP_ID=MMETSP1385-20130828/15498_1 /ASSEMBLY_ACC=CAM_ASM_000861 /TAXON_ID=933848 /ORGANISM="Elphidium margaritaceum" /LENGTH=379 /DNA_ID=CAMNT_0049360193 /DNA_START=36 /DNA_END=1175 /DNA_ORIENTATION=-